MKSYLGIILLLFLINTCFVMGHGDGDDDDDFHNPDAIWSDAYRASLRKKCRIEFLERFGPQPANWNPEVDYNVTGCYYACYLKHEKMMNEDGTLNPRVYVAFFRDTHGILNTGLEADKSIKIIDYCNEKLKISGITDECEAAKFAYSCPRTLNETDLEILLVGSDSK